MILKTVYCLGCEEETLPLKRPTLMITGVNAKSGQT